jgi:hypothetical protein
MDGVKTGQYDCDGTNKKFCYEDNTRKQCHTAPKCYSADRLNTVACDCNMDGNAQDNCKYCVKEQSGIYKCQETAGTVDSTAPKITSVVLGGVPNPAQNGAVIQNQNLEVTATDSEGVTDITVRINGVKQSLSWNPSFGAKEGKWITALSLVKGNTYTIAIEAHDGSSESPAGVKQYYNVKYQ